MRVPQWKKLETGSNSSGGLKPEPDNVVRKKTCYSGFSNILACVVAVAICILLLIGLFNVWNRMALVQLGYEISTLEAKNKELKGHLRELSLELASLESPVEIEKRATRQGLRMPSVGRIIHVP